jgi:alcohol dehydrogenase class IV
MLGLRRDLGLPHTLSGLPKIHRGLGKELAPLAAADPSLGSNPRTATLEELQSVFEKTFDGDLT